MYIFETKRGIRYWKILYSDIRVFGLWVFYCIYVYMYIYTVEQYRMSQNYKFNF